MTRASATLDLLRERVVTRGSGVGILSAVGRTPTVQLNRLFEERFAGTVFAKLEYLNPAGSAKDRPALQMIEAALADGRLSPGGVVIESSSGNMALGLAQVCAYHRLRLVCVMDPNAQRSTVALVRAYGAEVVVVDRPDPETGEWLPARRARVQALLAQRPDSFWPDQYSNPHNPLAHENGTASELIDDLGRPPDVLLVAASTCGTVAGISRRLGRVAPGCQVIAVDVVGSTMFGGRRGPRFIPGLGSSRKPDFVQPELLRVEMVRECDCVGACHLLARTEAIVAGGSSGAVIAATLRVVRTLPRDAVVATLLVDRGDRYLDTVYDERWVSERFGSISACVEGVLRA
jgi:cysteine synthase A